MPDSINGRTSWRNDPEGPYIRIAPSGRKVHLLSPKPADYQVRDIAFHLAGINRYTGGSRFSVAQHEVVGARMAERFYPDAPFLPARFMLHDIAEAIYNDMSSPLKSLVPEYRRLITDAERVVETTFNLSFLDDPLVREIDMRMWLTERLVIYRGATEDISSDYSGPLLPFEVTCAELEDQFGYWDPDFAECEWLDEFYRLLPWINEE